MPLTFGAFIGNETVVSRLRQTLGAPRRTPVRCHAYLITGPSQIGKETLAQTMGAALVCQVAQAPDDLPLTGGLLASLNGPHRATGDAGGSASDAGADVPCGVCRACRLVERAAHPDVHLVATESGRRGVIIDQIRQLAHDASLRPYEAACKVFVIAGVDVMSEAAANALLKTLEEPPADTVLILTAGDVSQVLPTIVSRCQELPLRPVAAGEIERGLLARDVAPEEARRLARLAAGRPGWAVEAAGDPQRVTRLAEQVTLLETLLSRPPRQRLPAAAESGDAGSTGQLLDVWLGWWRDALLVQQNLPELTTHVDRLDTLRRLGASHPPATIWRALWRIQQTRRHVEANANVRLALEALLLDLPEPLAAVGEGP